MRELTHFFTYRGLRYELNRSCGGEYNFRLDAPAQGWTSVDKAKSQAGRCLTTAFVEAVLDECHKIHELER